MGHPAWEIFPTRHQSPSPAIGRRVSERTEQRPAGRRVMRSGTEYQRGFQSEPLGVREPALVIAKRSAFPAAPRSRPELPDGECLPVEFDMNVDLPVHPSAATLLG